MTPQPKFTERLEAVAERLKASTPGPWEREANEDYWDGGWYTHRRWVTAFIDSSYNALSSSDQGKQVDANLDFIAHSTVDVTFLLEAVRLLLLANQKYESAIWKLRTWTPVDEQFIGAMVLLNGHVKGAENSLEQLERLA